MPTKRDLAVYDHAAELILLDRLDPKSDRELPKRLTTLLRRTVDATPHELRRILHAVAPPPKRAPAREYAGALIGLFQAYDALTAHRIGEGIDRIRGALERLAAVAGGARPSDSAARRVIEDALLWRAAALSREGRTEEHITLAEGHVALAGEGHLPTGYPSMRAAAFLAAEAAHRPDYERATRYAAVALRWGTESYDWFPSQLGDCVSILCEAGHYDTVIELAPPLLERYAVYDELDTDTLQPPETFTAVAVQVGADLAVAFAELGAHDEAMTFAADTLWRAIRRFGPDHPLTLSCQAAYAHRLFAAGRDDEGVGMMRPVFEDRRRRADENPREYIYTGITLAFGLDRIGNGDEARALASEITAYGARRLPCADAALLDAQRTQHLLDARA